MGTYDAMLNPAFAGMKADSGFGRVESFSAESAIPFGVVVTVGTKTNQVKLGGEKPAGVALHSHTIVGGYQQYDTVSVMTKGLVWCAVEIAASGETAKTVTDRGAVKFAKATGLVSDSGETALTGAVFRSGIVDAGKYGKLALVELG